MRKRLLHIVLSVMALLFTPMVVVMPWFQHVCVPQEHSNEMGDDCPIDISVPVTANCCGLDAEQGCTGCDGCGSEIKGFAFIDVGIIPSSDKIGIALPSFEIDYIYNIYNDLVFDSYSTEILISESPPHKVTEPSQSLLCVFIC